MNPTSFPTAHLYLSTFTVPAPHRHDDRILRSIDRIKVDAIISAVRGGDTEYAANRVYRATGEVPPGYWICGGLVLPR